MNQSENTRDLIVRDDFSKQLAELDKIQDTCKKLMSTKHYSNLGEAGIHAIIAKSKALGIHPFEALNGGFHCINGKVGMSTEMMAALVRKNGHSVSKDPKSTNECVILNGKRADSGDTWTCTFSKEDAEKAGLWNSATWKKYPAIMLYNRCMSMLFRQLFPDLSMGAGYVEDELKEIAKVDEYKLPLSEFEEIKVSPVVLVEKTDEPLKKDIELTPEERDSLVKEVKEILIDCGTDYEEKILKNYGAISVESLTNKRLTVIKGHAFNFREQRMKNATGN